MGWRMWTAAILAGGQARRLGGLDKSGLTIGSGPSAHSILDRQLTVLRSLTTDILIVGGAARGGREGLTIVPDRVAGAGALGGVYTALMEARTDQVLVIACDMPFLTAPFLAHLASLGGASSDGRPIDVVVPRDRHGRHPLCASYHRRCAPALKARIDRGALRVGDALEELSVREVEPEELSTFDPDGRLLLNVNTPDDYERAYHTE